MASMISNLFSTAVPYFSKGRFCFSLLKNADEPQTGHGTIAQENLGHQSGYRVVGQSLSLWHLDIPSRAESDLVASTA